MPIVTEEALEAFTLHMDRLVATHGEIVVVNLLDSEGKEAPLGDEFAKVVSSERGKEAPLGDEFAKVVSSERARRLL